MNVNVKKTKEMTIRPSSSKSNVFSLLNVADVTVPVDVSNLLVVYINRSLKWDDHVRTIIITKQPRAFIFKTVRLKRSSTSPDL